MSATGRGRARVDQDQYMTPDYTVMSLLNNDDPERWECGSVFDPCCGDGEILRRVKEIRKNRHVYGNDIDVKMCEMATHNAIGTTIVNYDFLSENIHDLDRFNITVTNPPYENWVSIVNKMKGISDFTWALLRLNVFGSQARNEYWNKPGNMPSELIILSKRPRFRKPAKNYWEPENYCCIGKGTDATEYAWFGWDNTKYMTFETKIQVVK